MKTSKKNINRYARAFQISDDIRFGYYIESKEELGGEEMYKFFVDSGLKKVIDTLIKMKLDEKADKLIKLNTKK